MHVLDTVECLLGSVIVAIWFDLALTMRCMGIIMLWSATDKCGEVLLR